MKQNNLYLLKEKYNFSKSDAGFLADEKKLKAGYPLAYLIGHIPFINCRINLSLKPLIPRPETEYLIDSLIKITPLRCDFKILDLCCGSGCIGIALLKNLPKTSLDFADIDSKALRQTQINLKINKINKRRYKIIKSNLFENIRGKYDLIITNPPYINPGDKFDKSLKYEPKKALFAPDKGLFYIKRILAVFPKYLKVKGRLYLEFGHRQKPTIEKFLSQSKNVKIHFIKDQFGKFRFLRASSIIGEKMEE